MAIDVKCIALPTENENVNMYLPVHPILATPSPFSDLREPRVKVRSLPSLGRGLSHPESIIQATLPQSLRRAKTLSPFGLAALTLSGKGKRFTDLS